MHQVSGSSTQESRVARRRQAKLPHSSFTHPDTLVTSARRVLVKTEWCRCPSCLLQGLYLDHTLDAQMGRVLSRIRGHKLCNMSIQDGDAYFPQALCFGHGSYQPLQQEKCFQLKTLLNVSLGSSVETKDAISRRHCFQLIILWSNGENKWRNVPS